MTRAPAVAAATLLLMSSAQAQDSSPPQTGLDVTTASPRVLFRDYALAACLGDALPAISAEAAAAANGYVQYGSGPYDAYKQATALARKFLERNYVSQTGANMSVMKCIDFSHSAEIDALIAKSIPKGRG